VSVAKIRGVRIIPSDDFGQWLRDTSSAGPITLLVGSAVSSFLPEPVPTGQTVTGALADLLSQNVPTRGLVRRLVGNTAFEQVMEACPCEDDLRVFVAGLYNIDRPNPCHKAIATLVSTKAVRHVITTNYDRCLDTAFQAVPIRRIVTKDDFECCAESDAAYFKIHGCASDPGSIVLTLKREAALENWRQTLFTRLINGHRLVVIGYSGFDFEICPELVRARPTLAWICYKAPRDRRPYHPSPGAIAVLQHKATSTAVHGNMLDVLAALGTTRPDPMKAKDIPIRASDFLFGRTPADVASNLDLWRCQLFRHIGCAKAAKAAAERLKSAARTTSEQATALHYLGLAAFHAGQYRTSAAAYRKAAALNPESRNGYLAEAVIADRCVGYKQRALDALAMLARELPSAQRPQLVLRQLEFLATDHDDAIAARDDVKALSLRTQAAPLVAELAGSSHIPGARMEHQQADLLARRLGLSGDIEPVPYAPARSREGFSQLGYFVAVATAVRQDLLEGTNLPDLDDALTMFADLHRMGAAAEAWKFGLALCLRYKTWTDVRLARVFARAVRDYARCQYTPALRAAALSQILARLRPASA
jgi:tetratricopeptide (TPR) repeat protein